MNSLKQRLYSLLRWSERYTKTDMVYLFTTGVWANAGTLFATGGSFFLYLIFSHFLPKETYGTYQYLLSLGVIVSAVTLTGMNAAVTRAVAKGNDGALRQAVRAQLRWSIFPLVCAWGAASYYFYQHNAVIGTGLLIIGILVPVNAALNTYGAFLSGKKDFRRSFLYGLWWNIPYYVTVGLCATFVTAAPILLAASLLSQTIGLYFAYRHTLKTYRPNRVIDTDDMRYGAQLSIIGVFTTITAQIDSVLTFHFLGPVTLAIYSFATAVPDRISALFKFIPAAAFPKFAEAASGKTPAHIGRRLLIAIAGTALAALLYVALAYPFFYVFFPQYLSAVPYSQLYAFSIIVSLNGIFITALTAFGEVRKIYSYNIVTTLVQLILLVLGIILYGLWGLIASRLLANTFALLYGWYLCHSISDSRLG